MSRNLILISALGALAFAASGLLVGAKSKMSQIDGFTVHEWGTFTSVAGADGDGVEWNVLGGEDDLPRFVNNLGYRNFKFRLTGTVRMETPVLFFYSPRELAVNVEVSFPKGVLTEWYPKAEYEIKNKTSSGAVYRLPANLGGIDTSMMSLIGGLKWTNIRVEPGTSPTLPREDGLSRYYAARATDAAPVEVEGQHEKFLFYRGVARFGVPLSARLTSSGKVALENCGTEIPLAILFENRAGWIGYRVASNVSGQVTFDRPTLSSSLTGLTENLANTLVKQGLFPKEAQAMIATWRDSWFENGARVIYIVPRQTVDSVLPLEIDPAPVQVTRVFVGRIELITPEIEREVEAALSANNRCELERYGRFLDPIFARIAADSLAGASEIEHFRADSGHQAACRI